MLTDIHRQVIDYRRQSDAAADRPVLTRLLGRNRLLSRRRRSQKRRKSGGTVTVVIVMTVMTPTGVSLPLAGFVVMAILKH